MERLPPIGLVWYCMSSDFIFISFYFYLIKQKWQVYALGAVVQGCLPPCGLLGPLRWGLFAVELWRLIIMLITNTF